MARPMKFPRRNDDPAVKEDPMHARTWDPDKSSVGAPYTGSVDFWWPIPDRSHVYPLSPMELHWP